MRSRFRLALHAALAPMVMGAVVSPAVAGPSAERDAHQILETAGVLDGLVVHLGCGPSSGSGQAGRLTAALHANDSFLVHGLATDWASIEAARKHIASEDLSEAVSIARFDGKHLPYRDSTANLVVAEALGDVPMTQVMRVLAPDGVALVKRDWRSYKTWWTTPRSTPSAG